MESNNLWVPVRDEGGDIILNLYLDGVTYLYEQLDELEYKIDQNGKLITKIKDGIEVEFIKNYYLKLNQNQPTYISEAFGVYDDSEDVEENFVKLQTILLTTYNQIKDRDLKKEYYKQFKNKKGKIIFRFKVYSLKRESQRSPQVRRFFDGHT